MRQQKSQVFLKVYFILLSIFLHCKFLKTIWIMKRIFIVAFTMLNSFWWKNCTEQKEKNYKEEKADDGNRRWWTCAIAVILHFFQKCAFFISVFLFIQFQPYKFAAEDKLQKTEFYSATSSDASASDQYIAAAECTRF